MFSNDSGMKTESNNKITENKITEKLQIIWKLNDTLLNNTQVKEEVPGEVTNYFELNKNITSKFVECNETRAQRKIYNMKCI